MNQVVKASLRGKGKCSIWFKDQMHLNAVASFMRVKRPSTAAHAAVSNSLLLVLDTAKAHRRLDKSTSDNSGSFPVAA